MSQLSLFAGPDLVDEPLIYSFKEYSGHSQRHEDSRVAERARLERENQSCPSCNRITVDAIELQDGIIGRNGARVFGTGTIVGFSCNACGHEWPA